MLSRPFGLWTKIRSRYHVRCSRIIFCLLLLHIIIQRNGLIPTAPVLRPHLLTISAKCVTFLQDWEFINAYFRQNYLFFVGDLAAYNEGNDIPASAVVSPRRLMIYNVAHSLPFRISSLSESPRSIFPLHVMMTLKCFLHWPSPWTFSILPPRTLNWPLSTHFTSDFSVTHHFLHDVMHLDIFTNWRWLCFETFFFVGNVHILSRASVQTAICTITDLVLQIDAFHQKYLELASENWLYIYTAPLSKNMVFIWRNSACGSNRRSFSKKFAKLRWPLCCLND